MEKWKLHFKFVALILFFVILSIPFWVSNLDIEISQIFYDEGEWPLKNSEPWVTLYEVTPVLGVISLIVFSLASILSFFVKRLVPYRWHFIFVACSFVIGCLLVVNVIFKPYYNRPRPNDVKNFGGKNEFVTLWHLGESGKSFPSGHAATGYFFGFAFFLLYRKRKKWAYTALFLSIILGTIIGMGRIVQGKHFASDILWSAGMMYIVMAWLYYYALAIPDRKENN